VLKHLHGPDHTSPSVKGDDMAASKDTRRSDADTNELFQSFFQNSQVSEEREQAWQDVVRHAGTRTPPLRFPVYEHLYFLNVYAQKMVDLLQEVSSRFGLNREISVYHQSLVQYVRAGACQELLESMAGIEHTEAWLFESLRRTEEKNLRDPDDVYFLIREREQERVEQGLPPRIRFLDDAAATR
jgi:hypothetical protein